MAGQSDLDQFDIDIRRDGDSVVAAIPQIGLFARGDSEAAALAALDEKKKQLDADVAVFKQLVPESNGAPSAPLRVEWKNITPFAIKAGIVFFLFVAGLTYSTIQLQQVVDTAILNIQSNLQRYSIRGGPQFWTNIERQLERAADPASDIPEEKKQKLLTEIKMVVDRWRPFVAEALAIFQEEKVTEATQSSPTDENIGQSSNADQGSATVQGAQAPQ